jgi:hypothetical protein
MVIIRKLDPSLYALFAAFAAFTAFASTLTPHRVWGQIALVGYVLATLLALFVPRWWLLLGTWVAVALVPLVVEAVQRVGGRTDRAQEEVLVVEQAGERLLHTGSPYLTRDEIAALPEPLLGYNPYQPGMAVFGLPRALAGVHWWTDARVWFALVTIGALAWAYVVLRADFEVLRAAQAATVFPVCALTLATGGDDIPVLALSLLAFAFAARSRFLAAGIAIGAAAALKLFAWPVALVLLLLALRRGRWIYLAPALGIPLVVLLPPMLVDAGAVIENVVRFPGGKGLVVSPAQSPLPGRLIATGVPGGPTIAVALLLLAGLTIAVWLVRRPLRDAADAALVSAVGLTAAIMLTPTTRFGYLLYPVAYAALWLAFRPVFRSPSPAAGRKQGE